MSTTDTQVYDEAMAETESRIDPEVATLIALIDAALSETANRSIVNADEMADLLLDIRACALGFGALDAAV